MTTLRMGSAALMVLLMACGGPERPPLPEGFDDAALLDRVDGKGDTLTRWFAAIKAELDFDVSTAGQTSYGGWFHGYTLELGAGDTVAIEAMGEYYGIVRLYGPQKSNGSWGSALAGEWIDYDKATGGFRGQIDSYQAPSAGTYLVLVGSPWDPTYSYTLEPSCSSGHCGNAFCVLYETTDAAGTSLQNLYAVNVETYAAGKQLLSQVSNFVNEQILDGACGEIALACPKIYKPVCGDSPGYAEQTFGNVCTFKAYLMGLAGASSEAKGHYEDGACPPACDPKAEWWRTYVSTDAKQCQVLKFYCQPYTLYFTNTCGCGCEQSKDCKQLYDCEPPIDCSSLKAKCPYSTFGL